MTKPYLLHDWAVVSPSLLLPNFLPSSWLTISAAVRSLCTVNYGVERRLLWHEKSFKSPVTREKLRKAILDMAIVLGNATLSFMIQYRGETMTSVAVDYPEGCWCSFWGAFVRLQCDVVWDFFMRVMCDDSIGAMEFGWVVHWRGIWEFCLMALRTALMRFKITTRNISNLVA